MKLLDSTLDASLIGYTRFGFMARGLSVHETFPSVAGKHVLVTGATRGIGRSMVERLAANGAIVHAVGRNPSALGDLVRLGEERVVAHTADLSSMESVADLATEFIASGQDLHGLINNVSVMSQERRVTAEGLELTYATNLLGQYVLTRRLLPALEAGSPSSVVMVSSGGMYSQGPHRKQHRFVRGRVHTDGRLRTYEAGRGRPGPRLGRRVRRGGSQGQLDAPWLGRHRWRSRLAPRLLPSHPSDSPFTCAGG